MTSEQWSYFLISGFIIVQNANKDSAQRCSTQRSFRMTSPRNHLRAPQRACQDTSPRAVPQAAENQRGKGEESWTTQKMLRMNIHFYRVGRTTARQVRDFVPKRETDLRVMDGRTDGQAERILPAGLFSYSHFWISYNESMCAFSVMSSCLRSPWTTAHQAPLCVGFSRQEYWSGLPFPPPGDLPDPGTEPESLESPVYMSLKIRKVEKRGDGYTQHSGCGNK